MKLYYLAALVVSTACASHIQDPVKNIAELTLEREQKLHIASFALGVAIGNTGAIVGKSILSQSLSPVDLTLAASVDLSVCLALNYCDSRITELNSQLTKRDPKRFTEYTYPLTAPFCQKNKPYLLYGIALGAGLHAALHGTMDPQCSTLDITVPATIEAALGASLLNNTSKTKL